MHDTGLEVTLSLDAEAVDDARSLTVTVDVHNPGAEPVRLDTLPLDYAPIVLHVRDEAGAPVPGMPPSVPPLLEEDTTILLAPGDRERFTYRISSLFPDPLPPGRYAIQFRVELEAGTLESDWVPFAVAPAG